jgi:inositol 2-dehydrogenase
VIKKLNIGLIGLGRLGKIYAHHLAYRVKNANLIAVADIQDNLAKQIANEFDVENYYTKHSDLIRNKNINAVVIISPTSTHKEIVIEAAKAGKSIFCEKPVSISLEEAYEMQAVVDKTGVFFQMGFQRRFDSGYIEAQNKIKEGIIGEPVVLKSSSRDPFAPPIEFCDPKKSGGLILDMGIHDFDVARMIMGDVKSVYSVGGIFAYPEMQKIGDIDNAIINMYFENGTIGTVDLSRNAVYGYDIRAEVLGTKGTLKIGYLRETPLLVMTKEGVSHDVVPHFMERFGESYYSQIQNFVDNVVQEKKPSITVRDGIAALQISIAATRSFKENRPIEIQDIKEM